MKNNKQIFISTSTFAEFSNKPIELLKKNNCNIELNKTGKKLDLHKLLVNGFNPMGIIAGTEHYSENIIDQLTNLKIISRVGVGLDNISLHYAKSKGIKVYRTKITPAKSVAELCLGYMFDLSRQISRHDKNMRLGNWQKNMGMLLSGKTLGIIGLGNNGRNLVELVSGLNLNIIAYDKNEDIDFSKKNKIQYCSLNSLLQKSDIISIHLNLSDETFELINNDQFSIMKSDAILINTSRGEIINENALYHALKSNYIKGAALDVFTHEPYSGPLLELENILLTPHIGSYAKEIRLQMEIEATKNLIKGLSEL